MMDDTLYAKGFGSFTLNGMNLALPIACIREVVPLQTLHPLPSSAQGVIGGLNLRGVTVPVLDMRLVLDKPAPPIDSACVIVVVACGKLIGLLSDTVKELFFVEPDSVNPIQGNDFTSRLFVGSVVCKEGNSLLSVLSAQALVELPRLPLVNDPEPHRLDNQSSVQQAEKHNDHATPIMLIKCGKVRYAIDPNKVETTLSSPKIHSSEVSGGFLMGVIEYRNQAIPAVNLSHITRLEAGVTHGLTQAFVIRMASGAVAFVVEKVVDIVNVDYQCITTLHHCSTAAPQLIKGVLPNTRLNSVFLEKNECKGPQHFVLCAQSILDHPALVDIAHTIAQTEVQSTGFDMGHIQNQADTLAQRLVTFFVHDELATPIAQIVKVLPYSADIEVLEPHNQVLGYVFNNEESVQVLSLAHVLTGQRQELGEHASILIVDLGTQRIGFAVQSLKTIESSTWEKNIPVLGKARQDAGNFGADSLPHVQVGRGAEERMLRLLDLVALGRRIVGHEAIEIPVATDQTDPIQSLDASIA